MGTFYGDVDRITANITGGGKRDVRFDRQPEQPPIKPERYHGTGVDYDGPGFATSGELTLIDTFAGPVDRITASNDGKPLAVHFARWSAHPELVVYWMTGVFRERSERSPKVTIYDASGKVIGPG